MFCNHTKIPGNVKHFDLQGLHNMVSVCFHLLCSSCTFNLAQAYTSSTTHHPLLPCLSRLLDCSAYLWQKNPGLASWRSSCLFPIWFSLSILSTAYCLMSSVSTSETIISRELWLITTTAPYMCAYAYHLFLMRLEVMIHSLEQWFHKSKVAAKEFPIRNLLKCRFLDCLGRWSHKSGRG